jgi:GT2 family glycosyltransferase
MTKGKVKMKDMQPAPEATIIIVSFNEADKTVQCLQSLRAHCPLSREIIWVDNGSKSDGFSIIRRAATRPRMRTKLIRFDDNMGFVQGVNSAIPEIDKRSKYVILLNNDTLVGPRTLSKLVKPLSVDDKIGATSCITQSRISWQEAKHLNRRWPSLKVPEYCGDPVRYTKKLEEKFDGKCIDVGSLNFAFFCVAFRKEVFVDVLEGLDKDFGIGLGEDDYACHKLRFLGYKQYLVMDAFVYHHHRTTFHANKLSVDGIRRVNIRTLKRKIKALEKGNA